MAKPADSHVEEGERSVVAKRGPGRPPDLEKRRAIIDATLELLAEVGYASLTIDAVAQRAGSNRNLVYRVWDSKVALVRDALFGVAAGLVLPDTGSTREDLRLWVAQHVDRMSFPAYVKGVPALTVELQRDPALFRDTFTRYIEPTEHGFRTIIERGRERGQVQGDVDVRVLTYVVSGTITGLAQATRLSAAAITDVVMQALDGGIIRLAE